MTAPAVRALVLAAHGSRHDPEANGLVRRLAQSLREPKALRRGGRRLPPGRAGVRGRARRASATESHCRARPGERGTLCRRRPSRGPRPEPAIHRRPAQAESAGGDARGHRAARGAPGDGAAPRGQRRTRSGVARSWSATAPAVMPTAGPPRCSSPRRSGAAALRARCSPASGRRSVDRGDRREAALPTSSSSPS